MAALYGRSHFVVAQQQTPIEAKSIRFGAIEGVEPSERVLYARDAVPPAEPVPDLLRLGEFRPHWEHDYPSFHIDRTSLWRSIVADAIQGTHLREQDMQGSNDVRPPAFHQQDWSENTIINWHCDNHARLGDNDGAAAMWIVAWANLQPTEFRAPDGHIFQGDPYELLAWRNGSYEHRMPTLTQQEAASRWFARQYIDVPVVVHNLHNHGPYIDRWQGTSMKNIVYNPGMVSQKDDAFLDEIKKYIAKPIDRELLKKRYPQWFITSEA